MVTSKFNEPQSSFQCQHSSTDLTSREVTFIDLFIIFWKGKFIFISCIFLASLLGIIYSLFATEFFSTSSLFITKTGNQSGGNLSQLASLAGLNIGNTGTTDPSDYIDKVILDKDFLASLFERNWPFKGGIISLEQIFKIKMDTTVANWENIYFMNKIETVRKSNFISLKKDFKTGLLTLTTTAPDPYLAFEINEFTLNYLSNYIRNSIKSQAKEKRVFIEDRIMESKNELEISEDELAKFRESNLMTSSPQMNLEEARFARKVALNQEIYIQLKKQFEMAKIEELDDQALIQIVKSAEIPIERSKPNRKMIVFLSFLCGILIGLIMIFLIQSIFVAKIHIKNRI